MAICHVNTIGGGGASAEHVRVVAAMGQPYVLVGDAQTAYLRVTLSGIDAPREMQRAPVNLAIVMDCSGSMQNLLDGVKRMERG